MKKISQKQEAVLLDLADQGRLFKPRHTLELLQKKGLVKGDKREGWRLTDQGFVWLSAIKW